MRRFALFVIPIALVGATARLYDLESGTSVELKYKINWFTGHGTIAGTLVDGRKVAGEYRTIEDRVGQHGSTVLLGKDIVIECDYDVGENGHGTGTCRDNQKKRYKIMF